MHIDKPLGVAFIWHMHQPFYKDPLEGTYLLPWVRLHGIKDYYPMAALVEDLDAIRVTFNVVPSLVEQINDYVENDATDTFLDLTVKKAGHLTFEEKVEALNSFFKVNFPLFIEPNPRYTELLMKKGLAPLSGGELKAVVKSFSDQDLLDLQVLFNLSWFHSLSIDEDINLQDLLARKSGYSEADKEYVVMKQKEILGQILPLYRRLQDAGRIEITVTPFYHPITPLVCDTDIGHVSLPGKDMPKPRFAHPEDARWHITSAIKYHTAQFGVPPAGMWPSEGSVSDEALALMAKSGIRWVATDEEILFQSLMLHDKEYDYEDTAARNLVYEPYAYKTPSGDLDLIFRDKNLSNLISFEYHKWDQEKAAADLIAHCRRIGTNFRDAGEKGLLTIVMDGENAWEFYRDNGRKFFETLYADLDRQSELYSTTVSDYLAARRPRKTIARIFPGSWINHNFDIWIGQEQDNLSWEYLGKVRQDLVRFTREAERDRRAGTAAVERAWREFYIAEGSDWNWWYGGKVRSGGENPFDEIYRMHLKNVYRILKKPIPAFLDLSIS